MLIIACVITTAIVSVWLTVTVTVAVKNYMLERALKRSANWQRRARRAEAVLQAHRARDEQGRRLS